MNWDAVGAVSEGVGSLAVFITLGYLAIQVGHARQEARRALSQGRLEALRDLFQFGSEERIARITTQADTALNAAATPIEAALMSGAGMTWQDAQTYVNFQAAFWNYQLHVLSNIDELSGIERTAFEMGIRFRYRPSSVGRLFYEALRPHSHPDVVRYIDGLLAQPA
jgi:hypothetical protein